MPETTHPVAERLRSLARTLEERFTAGAAFTIDDAIAVLQDIADVIDPPLPAVPVVCFSCKVVCPDCEEPCEVQLGDFETPVGIIQCSECGTFFENRPAWERLTAWQNSRLNEVAVAQP